MRDYVSVYKMGSSFYHNDRTEKNEPIKWEGLYDSESPSGYNPKAFNFTNYETYTDPTAWDPVGTGNANVKARSTRRKLNTISRCVHNAPRKLSGEGRRSFVYTRILDPKMYRKAKLFKVS